MNGAEPPQPAGPVADARGPVADTDGPDIKGRVADTKWSTVVKELLWAIAGLGPAYVVTYWLSHLLGLGVRHGVGGFVASTALFVFFALVAIYLTSGRPIRAALDTQRAAIAEQAAELRATAQRHEFVAELQQALEMSETERDALVVVGRALTTLHAGQGELLLTDSSQAHLRTAASSAAGSPGCTVATPWGCPAVRRGHAIEFPLSATLSACPRLNERGDGLSATCVPVTILGAPMGVLHVTGPAGEPFPDATHVGLESLAVHSGARIGMLRAMATSQRAASTDPLTGLLNRRSLDDRLRELVLAGHRFAIGFGDLDHFKALNDTHGHATGDRALRLFATVASEVVRDGDLVCRYGGEEFVIVFVGCDVVEAAPVVHRLRRELRTASTTAGLPAFTISFGLSDSTQAHDPLGVVDLADDALLAAKRDGRDRLMIAEAPGEEPSEAALT